MHPSERASNVDSYDDDPYVVGHSDKQDNTVAPRLNPVEYAGIILGGTETELQGVDTPPHNIEGLSHSIRSPHVLSKPVELPKKHKEEKAAKPSTRKRNAFRRKLDRT